MKMPLLIGGATTSRVHTAVKIDPNYKGGPVVHVNDASRAVGVASSLLSLERREAYAADIRAEYAKISAAHFRAQADKKRLKLADARANSVKPISRRHRRRSRHFWASGVSMPTIWRSWPNTSTGRPSSRLGNWRDVFRRFSTTPRSAKSPARFMTTRARCSTASSRRSGSRRALPSASGRPMPRATISPSMPTTRGPARSRPSTRCASNWRSVRAASTPRCRTSSRLGPPAYPIISAASSLPQALARTRSPTASRTPMTITPRSCARHWPTVWRRPLPSGCTSACARSSGVMRRTRRWPRTN